MKRILLILVLGVLFIIADMVIVSSLRESYVSKQYNYVNKNVSTIRAQLESEITTDLFAISALASYVSTHPHFTQESFDTIAESIMLTSKHLLNLAAAPDYKLSYVYPLEGNEAILGINYKDVPSQWEEVKLVRDTGKMVIAGPIDLIQGGRGLIGRAPVVIKGKENKNWGIVSAVIDFDNLMRGIVNNLKNMQLNVAVYKKAQQKEKFIKMFESEEPVDDLNNIQMSVIVPNGEWMIKASPSKGWGAGFSGELYVHSATFILFLILSLALLFKYQKDIDFQKQKEHTKQLIERTTDAYFEVDREFNVIYLNSKTEEQLKIKSDEVLGKSLWQTLPDVIGSAFHAKFHEAVDTLEIVKFEGYYAPSDTWYEVTAFPTEDKLSVYFQDINARKTLEEAVTASKNQLDVIFDTTRDGIAIMDLDTNFLHCNKAYEKLTGRTYDELMQLSSINLSMEEDIPRAKEAVEHVKRFGYIENFEKISVAKSGAHVKVQMAMVLMADEERLIVSTRDITDMAKTQDELKESKKQLQRYVKIVDEDVITSQTDLDGIITYASEAFCRISGYEKGELIGKSHNVIRHPDMTDETFVDLWETIRDGRKWRKEIKNLKKDGGFYWVDTYIVPLTHEDGEAFGYMAVMQDITAKKELERISVTDRLTGLYNRMKIDSSIQSEHKRYLRYQEPYSLILFDIDHFKSVNDTHGHLIGDYVLKELSRLTGTLIRETDVLGRWGGEEFLVICPKTEIDGALILAENMRKAIEEHPFEHVNKITSSFGVASVRTAGDYDMLMKVVDDALYAAKKSGRNCVRTP